MHADHRALTLLAIAATVAVGCGAVPRDRSAAAARAELRGLIEDVTAATAHRYNVADDRG